MNKYNPINIDELFSKPDWIYPGGEIGINLRTQDSQEAKTHHASMTCRIQNSDDLMRLVMTVNASKKNGIILPKTLIIPYLPYARQDRVAAEGDPHALQAFCEIIDNLGFKEVVVIDAHSNVAEACFKNTQFTNITPEMYLSRFIDRAGLGGHGNIALICPDEGAIKKIQHYAKYLGSIVSCVFYCTKKRDPMTGKLTGFDCNIPDMFKLAKNANLVIADDICDGGGTFLGIADMIKAKIPDSQLHLFTTHGIYSKGTDVLYSKFKTVGCTNSFVPNDKYKNEKPAIIIPFH